MKVSRLFVGDFKENCYVVATGQKNALVVDPGAEPGKILKKLAEEGLKLTFILLTHGHYDHVGAINELCAKTGCQTIYVGKADIELLKDAKKSVPEGLAWELVQLEEKEIKIAEGEIELDELKIEVIKTPGHTKGGVCYFVGGVLFSGDTLFRGTVGRTDFYGGNKTELERSLKRLSTLPEETVVCPGHGLKTSIKNEFY